MTALEYLDEIDDTLSNWEDYFHGEEGRDVTNLRSTLDRLRQILSNLEHAPCSTCTACGAENSILSDKQPIRIGDKKGSYKDLYFQFCEDCGAIKDAGLY